MRIPATLGLLAALLAAGCATYSIENTDITLQPGGYVHVHGRDLRVKALSRGPGTLSVSMRDGDGNELARASLGTGRWNGGDVRATDVWFRNESPEVIALDVWAGGSNTVAVATLAAPPRAD